MPILPLACLRASSAAPTSCCLHRSFKLRSAAAAFSFLAAFPQGRAPCSASPGALSRGKPLRAPPCAGKCIFRPLPKVFSSGITPQDCCPPAFPTRLVYFCKRISLLRLEREEEFAVLAGAALWVLCCTSWRCTKPSPSRSQELSFFKQNPKLCRWLCADIYFPACVVLRFVEQLCLQRAAFGSRLEKLCFVITYCSTSRLFKDGFYGLLCWSVAGAQLRSEEPIGICLGFLFCFFVFFFSLYEKGGKLGCAAIAVHVCTCIVYVHAHCSYAHAHRCMHGAATFPAVCLQT